MLEVRATSRRRGSRPPRRAGGGGGSAPCRPRPRGGAGRARRPAAGGRGRGRSPRRRARPCRRRRTGAGCPGSRPRSRASGRRRRRRGCGGRSPRRGRRRRGRARRRLRTCTDRAGGDPAGQGRPPWEPTGQMTYERPGRSSRPSADPRSAGVPAPHGSCGCRVADRHRAGCGLSRRSRTAAGLPASRGRSRRARAASGGTISGTTTSTVVPLPGVEVTVSWPPSRSARERIPVSPRWPSGTLVGSKPRPSSVTSRRTPSGTRPTSSRTCARAGVLDDVVERLLGDPVERLLDLDRRPLRQLGLDHDRQPDPPGQRRRVRAQRLDQAVLLDVARPELEDQRPHLGQGVALQLAQRDELLRAPATGPCRAGARSSATGASSRTAPGSPSRGARGRGASAPRTRRAPRPGAGGRAPAAPAPRRRGPRRAPRGTGRPRPSRCP